MDWAVLETTLRGLEAAEAAVEEASLVGMEMRGEVGLDVLRRRLAGVMKARLERAGKEAAHVRHVWTR